MMQWILNVNDCYSRQPRIVAAALCSCVHDCQPYRSRSQDVGLSGGVFSSLQPLDNSTIQILTSPLKHQQPNNISIMALVDYSDSDASDVEEKPVAKPTPHPSKPAFQKVVDRSNPGKIKVSLPQAALKDDTKSDEPPAKRAKLGGGGLSGFNSFLPAPKRTGPSANATLGGGNAARKGGLGAGVNLKTGAAPGFSREPEPEREYADDLDEKVDEEPSGPSVQEPEQEMGQKSGEEVKLVGKPLMFKPLSVARKPVKKKKAIPASAPTASATRYPIPTTPSTPQTTTQKPQRPRVSLFSTGIESSSLTPASNSEYKPMIYHPEADEAANGESFPEPLYEDYTPTTSQVIPPSAPTPPVSQSLDDIAGDLNLSAAERRQLFGRQKGGRNNGPQAATRVINFNTDKEYLHNEELRASGEQIAHNPVRALAAGKHSLKQLINSAQSQKDALEESFAKGRSNRAEASSRYGW